MSALFVWVRWHLQGSIDPSVTWTDSVHYIRWWVKIHYWGVHLAHSFDDDRGLAKESVESLYAQAADECTPPQQRYKAVGVLLRFFRDYLIARSNRCDRDGSDPLAPWNELRDAIRWNGVSREARFCCRPAHPIDVPLRPDGYPVPARARLLPVFEPRGNADEYLAHFEHRMNDGASLSRGYRRRHGIRLFLLPSDFLCSSCQQRDLHLDICSLSS